MRASLARWIGDADALRHLEHFHVQQISVDFTRISTHIDDYYFALVGELFECIREDSTNHSSLSRLGNAFSQLASGQDDLLRGVGISKSEAKLFAAAAFYCGGFPASAYLTIRDTVPMDGDSEPYRACFDLLARPSSMTSRVGQTLVDALQIGNMSRIDTIVARRGSRASIHSRITGRGV